jgi:hypothetical protein
MRRTSVKISATAIKQAPRHPKMKGKKISQTKIPTGLVIA